MNEIISTVNATIGGEEVNAVNARELHKFLNSKQEFANWIKNRISEYDFKQGLDFDLINLSNQKGRGGDRRSIDYIISLDMAKELAMVENNDRGRQARQYFIEIERNSRRIESAVNNQIAAIIPIIKENERLKAKYEFARHFLPYGQPGELNENGEPKTRFRRGYYCAGNGRSITALIETKEQPGLFEEFQLKQMEGEK